MVCLSKVRLFRTIYTGNGLTLLEACIVLTVDGSAQTHGSVHSTPNCVFDFALACACLNKATAAAGGGADR